jgi:hypothetical protein
MGRYIDTGNREWLNADKITSLHIEERRPRNEAVYNVVAVLDGATWDAGRNAWDAGVVIRLDDPADGNEPFRSDVAVGLIRHLVAWLTTSESGIYSVPDAAAEVEQRALAELPPTT